MLRRIAPIARRCRRSEPRHPRVARSLSSLAGFSAETVDIPRQDNGNITLDVLRPTRASDSANTATSVLVYLPRGPSWTSEENEDYALSLLRIGLPCHIVRVNYRLGQQHQYPTPVHDVLAGYDWVLENLLPKRSINRAGRPEHVGRLAVCGELIGGGLASMLALTECRVGEVGITAAAVNNPVVDWVALRSTTSSMVSMDDASYSKGETLSMQPDLFKARACFFRKPEHYFDPFASPILFFRSAGEDVPPEPKSMPLDEWDVLSASEREGYLSEAESANSDPSLVVSVAQRRASRRFPGKNSGLRLPLFRISAGQSCHLVTQATDFTRLLEQGYARQNKHRMSGWLDLEPYGVHGDEFNEWPSIHKMAGMQGGKSPQYHPGLGLWDATSDGQKRVLEVAEWLKQQLRL